MNEAKEFERRLAVKLAEQQRQQVLPAWSLVTATVVGVFLVIARVDAIASGTMQQWMFFAWLAFAWTGTTTLLLLGLIPQFASFGNVALFGISAGVFAEAALLVYSPGIAASPVTFAILALPLGVAVAWVLRLRDLRTAVILVAVPVVGLLLGIQARLIH